MKNFKRGVTLFEMIIAIALILLASGAIGFKMHGAVRKKRFHSELDRLRLRFTVVQKLAIAMQADWKGVLKKEKGGWIVETKCEEANGRKIAPLHLDQIEIFFNGKKLNGLTIDFFSSGYASPEGVFVFLTDSERVEWKTSDLFLREQGKKEGPLFP